MNPSGRAIKLTEPVTPPVPNSGSDGSTVTVWATQSYLFNSGGSYAISVTTSGATAVRGSELLSRLPIFPNRPSKTGFKPNSARFQGAT